MLACSQGYETDRQTCWNVVQGEREAARATRLQGKRATAAQDYPKFEGINQVVQYTVLHSLLVKEKKFAPFCYTSGTRFTFLGGWCSFTNVFTSAFSSSSVELSDNLYDHLSQNTTRTAVSFKVKQAQGSKNNPKAEAAVAHSCKKEGLIAKC